MKLLIGKSVFLLSILASPVLAQSVPCGGSFSSFLNGVRTEALAAGYSQRATDDLLKSAELDPNVLSRDRAQGVFKQTFLEFSQRSISSYRMTNGAKNMDRYVSVFDRARSEFGVPAEVIAAFWALETDYGAVQGDFNTVNALATLAHDCRRPELFRPQLLAAIKMVENGDLDPDTTTGAWAGEIGQVQMLPEDILTKGVDGDGDGHVRLKTSAPDAILTAASLINALGWAAGEPWLIEVTTTDNTHWAKSGLRTKLPVSEWEAMGLRARSGNMPSDEVYASLLAPQGRNGPKFLAFRNFDVYLKWNQSFIYSTTAAYLATRLGGAARYDAGTPDQGLDDPQMKQLQTILEERGYDVGKVDGILGARTRNAVQAEQIRMGLPADAWPTPEFLARY
ncbi:MAG: lytic murein transglycosylase [Rhodobacteraceae bacterium]|nr:lytic murein transglycosylase [Paracoccaceae bacterium]